MAFKLSLQTNTAILLLSVCFISRSRGDLSEPILSEDPSPSGVSVPVSAAVSDLFKKAEQLEMEKQWTDADEVYQKIIRQFGSQVISTGRAPQAQSFQYEGVTLAVQERIAKWPVDGLSVYNDNHVRALSSTTTDAAEIFDHYFSTEAGKQAGICLMDREIENGDFFTAQWTGNRLLSTHPLLGNDRPMIMYRTAMASHWAGDDPAASALSRQLLNSAPYAKGLIGGQTLILANALARAVQIPARLADEEPTDDIKDVGVNKLETSQPILNAMPPIKSLMRCIALDQPDYAGVSVKQKLLYQNLDESEVSNDLLTQINPVSEGGALFLQDGRCLYALDGISGKPLPQWLATYPDHQAGRFHMATFGRVRNEPTSLTATAEVVLAVMGQRDLGVIGTKSVNTLDMSQSTSAKLVCLDRKTGAMQWAKAPQDLPAKAEALRGGEYSGKPVVYHSLRSGAGDSILIALHDSKLNGFDETHVVSVSLASGEYQWSTYIGGEAKQSSQGERVADKPSQLVEYQGRVVVMDNRGSIAAIDAETGHIIWMFAYQPQDKPANHHDRSNHKINEPFDRLDQGPRAWTYNPPFISQGSIFALPADANSLFILNLNTGFGKEVSMVSFQNAAMCLGVCRESVVLTTDNDLYVANWKVLSENASANALQWSEIKFSGDDSNVICGRGVLNDAALYIPTRNRLYQFSLNTQRIVDVYPSQGYYSGNEGAGNLLVTVHNFLVAQPRQVLWYLYHDKPN